VRSALEAPPRRRETGMRTRDLKSPVRTGSLGVSTPPPGFGVSAMDWEVLFTAHLNLLFVGDETVTAEMIDALLPVLREPVWTTTAAPLSLPSASPGTLIVQQATRLAVEDQVRLLQWLSDYASDVQVVTTTPNPLLPLVRRGAFLEALYYRLNVIYLPLARP